MKTNGRIVLMVMATTLVAGMASADQVRLNAALGQPVLLAGEANTTYLKVGLTGFKMENPEDRAPVNVAIVLDKSGSMGGAKMQQARKAAIAAIDRLDERDIVSVVTYDDVVRVVVPATKVSDREQIYAGIRGIEAGGSTALFGGVSKGAAEVRKFIDRERVNRLILLSDGLANVGPSSPAELADLGTSLAREGVSVTTLGLGNGYNEDLMNRLALASDGNHAFVEGPTDLARILNHEFGDVLSVVAKDVVVTIDCADGIRPVRVLGREADIDGRRVTTTLRQLYAEQEKFVLLEVEVPKGEAGEEREIASVSVAYNNLQTKVRDELTSRLAARFTTSSKLVKAEENAEVMAAVVLLLSTERNRLAMLLRDEGKIEEARQALIDNGAYIRKAASELDGLSPQDSAVLKKWAGSNTIFADQLADEDYRSARKEMVEDQNVNASQRAW